MAKEDLAHLFRLGARLGHTNSGIMSLMGILLDSCQPIFLTWHKYE